jgi:peptidoglycan/LPS O-acetylase OafA/YrhL
MHSYGNKVAEGMNFVQFTQSRIARLGPLYVVGLALGIAATLLSMNANPNSPIQPHNLAKAASLNMIVMPYFNREHWPFGNETIHGTVFPLNDPAWSLFFEMFVNLVFFVYLYKYRKINLAVSVAIAGFCFVALTLYLHQLNPGARGDFFWLGFPRVIFEFFLGVLIYQAYHRYKEFPPPVSLGLLAIVSAGFFSTKGAIALVNALVLAPLLIAILAKAVISGAGVSWCKWLGDISYPLYVTHFPVYRLLYDAGIMREATPVAQTCCYAGIAVFLAVILVKLDAIIRGALAANRIARLNSVES